MSAAAMDVQVLSHTVPGVQADLHAATTRDHARFANDDMARVVAERPDGRSMRRASATPCSRCRSASLSRMVQTPVLPRLTSASARRFWARRAALLRANDGPSCGQPDASNERGARRRGARAEAARRVTAAGRRGPQLRWRPLPENLIDRRGAALAPPILLASALNVAAVIGLAYIAGFHAVYVSLTRIVWPWLLVGA